MVNLGNLEQVVFDGHDVRQEYSPKDLHHSSPGLTAVNQRNLFVIAAEGDLIQRQT